MKSVLLAPHLDDAVLSCGGMLCRHAGAFRIVTVFCGHYEQSTHWDRKCGFRDGRHAMDTRLKENAVALARLGCTDHRHLPFLLGSARASVGQSVESQSLSDAIERIVREPDVSRVYFPVGIRHPDHHELRQGVLPLIAAHPDRAFIAYEDYPYLRNRSEWASALKTLREAFALRLERIDVTDVIANKAAVIAEYASQTNALFQTTTASGIENLLRTPETCRWRHWTARWRRRSRIFEQYWHLCPRSGVGSGLSASEPPPNGPVRGSGLDDLC